MQLADESRTKASAEQKLPRWQIGVCLAACHISEAMSILQQWSLLALGYKYTSKFGYVPFNFSACSSCSAVPHDRRRNCSEVGKPCSGSHRSWRQLKTCNSLREERRCNPWGRDCRTLQRWNASVWREVRRWNAFSCSSVKPFARSSS